MTYNNSYVSSTPLVTIGSKNYYFGDIFTESTMSGNCNGTQCIVSCSCKAGWTDIKPSSGGYAIVNSPRIYAHTSTTYSARSTYSVSSTPQQKTCYKKVTCEDIGYFSAEPANYTCNKFTVKLGSVDGTCYRNCYGYFYLHMSYASTLTSRKESNFKNDANVTTCSGNKILVGRYHSGDENGTSQLKCGTFHVHSSENTSTSSCYSGLYGFTVTVENTYWTDWKGEKGSSFNAPYGYVIIGREHSGDERGKTRYLVGKVYVSNGKNKSTATLYDATTTASCKESKCGWVEKTGPYMMTGRRHDGDENGQTTYTFKKGKAYLAYE